MKAWAWLVLVWGAAAHADVVEVSMRQGVPGKAPPAVILRVLEPIRGFHLRLQRSDGEGVELKDKAKVGQVRTVPLPQPDGRFRYEGTLEVTDREGTPLSMPLLFDTELWGPLQLQLDKAKDVDLAARALRFRLNRPAARAIVEVFTESGERAWQGEFTYAGESAGTALEATWGKVDGEVLRISVRAFDAAGSHASVDLFPYSVHVPHDEVVFDTGTSDIRPDQEPRLAAPLGELKRRLERASRWAPVQLYVVGHTDRVGDAARNRTLSVARARAIGQYFRAKGVRVPIFVEGFGEQVPRVSTPDETPEEQNRRVDYILSVGEPGFAGLPFPPAWRKL
jgi:outer membrane protein OmpA-like peptidoglycan-associated protein